MDGSDPYSNPSEDYVQHEEVQEEYDPGNGEALDLDGDFVIEEDMEEGDAEGEGAEGEGEGEGDETMEVEVQNDSAAAFTQHTDSVYCISLHPQDQDLVATGGGDDRAFIWRISTCAPLFELKGHKDSVVGIEFSGNGKYLATGGMDGIVKIWNVADGALVADLEGPDEIIWIKWHPKGNILIGGGQDGSAWMWAANGQVMQVFSGHTGPVLCGGFTPDGKLLVTGSEDCSVVVWDPKTAQPLYKFKPEDSRLSQGAITSLGFHPDSSIIAAGSDDHSVKLLHVHTGRVLASLMNHTEGVECISFHSSDENLSLVCTGGIDGKICIWDTQTLRLRHTLTHEDAVVKAEFCGDRIVSCSMDRTVRVWDARSGALLHKLSGHYDPILDLAVSKDGKTIVSTSDDQRALIFKV